jgi:hypothetical protein
VSTNICRTPPSPWIICPIFAAVVLSSSDEDLSIFLSCTARQTRRVLRAQSFARSGSSLRAIKQRGATPQTSFVPIAGQVTYDILAVADTVADFDIGYCCHPRSQLACLQQALNVRYIFLLYEPLRAVSVESHHEVSAHGISVKKSVHSHVKLPQAARTSPI